MESSTSLVSACLVWVAMGTSAAVGAPIVQDRATDLLTLAGGERLFGILAGAPHGGKIRIAVDRKWFRKHYPDLYDKTVAGEDDRRRQTLEQLRNRLTEWRKRREGPKLLLGFIERSLAQTEQRLRALDDEKTPPEPSQLVLVEVPVVRVRKQYVQPVATRRVLALAWQERLPGAEEQTAAALIEQLKAKGIDPELASPDLSDRLGALTQDERQWAAKVALVEYQILGKPHYQGSGSKLFRNDSGQARPDLSEIIGGQLEDQIGDLLGGLFDPNGGAQERKGDDKFEKALDDAARETAAEGLNSLRVSYLSWDLANHKLTVQGRLLARMPDGAWRGVWEHSVTLDTSQPRTEREDQLAKDPQFADILGQVTAMAAKAAKALGANGAEVQIGAVKQQVLRFAAVAEEATRDVNRAFAEFMLPNVRRLDGPPIAVPDAPVAK